MPQNLYAPGCRFNQSVDVTDERGFAAARKPHNAEDFAPMHVERDIGNADYRIKTRQNLALAQALFDDSGHRILGALAENFPNPVQFDCDITQKANLAPCRFGQL